MKKWHMEGILNKANDLQRKVVFGDRNQIVICPGSYSVVNRRKVSLMNYFRVFSILVLRRN